MSWLWLLGVLILHFDLANAFSQPGSLSTLTTQGSRFVGECITNVDQIPSPSTLETFSSTTVIAEAPIALSNLLDAAIHNPVFWSLNVMLFIIALLASWEASVEFAKERTPPPIIPVIENILGEMGGLGFIGLVLSALLNQAAFGDFIGGISEQFLGEKDILLESFEFLHETFFQAAMAFFATAAFIIARVLWYMQTTIDLADSGVLDQKSLEKASKIGRFIDVEHPENVVQFDGIIMKEFASETDPFWSELTRSDVSRGAETLVIRERLKREFDLPDTFRIHTYIENVFASCKVDVVKISPLSWLPLIPTIALANAVDLSNDVVSTTAQNAVLASGFFLSTPWFFYPKALIEILCLGWGTFNFWKIANIKSFMVPKVTPLEGSEEEEGLFRLLPPAIENEDLRKEFGERSTPLLARPVESLYAAPPTNRVGELFGVVGGNGLDFYVNSIKFHTWLVVTSLVVFTSNILPRDVYALTHLDTVTVGNPDLLIPEILVFGAFALLNIAQLLVQPTVFLNYCLIACVEDNVRSEALSLASNDLELDS